MISNRRVAGPPRGGRVILGLVGVAAIALLVGCSSGRKNPISPGNNQAVILRNALDIFRTATDPQYRWQNSPFKVQVRETMSADQVVSKFGQTPGQTGDRELDTYRGSWNWQMFNTIPQSSCVPLEPLGNGQYYPDAISGQGYTYFCWLPGPPDFSQVSLFKNTDTGPPDNPTPDNNASFAILGTGTDPVTFGPRIGLADSHVAVAYSHHNSVTVSCRPCTNISNPSYEGQLSTNNSPDVNITSVYNVDIVGHTFHAGSVTADVFLVVASAYGNDSSNSGTALVGWTLILLPNISPILLGPRWVCRPGDVHVAGTKVAVEVDSQYCHVAWLDSQDGSSLYVLKMISGALPACLAGPTNPFNENQLAIWTDPYNVAEDAGYYYAQLYPGVRSFEIDTDQRGDLAVAYLSPTRPELNGVDYTRSYVKVRWFRHGGWTRTELLWLPWTDLPSVPGPPFRSLDMEYDSFGGTHVVATGYADQDSPDAWYARHNGEFWEIPQELPKPPLTLSSQWNNVASLFYLQACLAVTSNYDCEFGIIGNLNNYSMIYLSRSRHQSSGVPSQNPPAMSVSTSLVDIPPWPSGTDWQRP